MQRIKKTSFHIRSRPGLCCQGYRRFKTNAGGEIEHLHFHRLNGRLSRKTRRMYSTLPLSKEIILNGHIKIGGILLLGSSKTAMKGTVRAVPCHTQFRQECEFFFFFKKPFKQFLCHLVRFSRACGRHRRCMKSNISHVHRNAYKYLYGALNTTSHMVAHTYTWC